MKLVKIKMMSAAVLIAAIVNVSMAQPTTKPVEPVPDPVAQRVESLRQRFITAVKSSDWNTALDVGMAIHEIHPDEGDAAYNIARVFALLNDVDHAFEWLQKAAESGFSSSEMVREDEKFTILRGDPRFEQTLNLIDTTRQSQFETIKATYDDQQLLTILPPGYKDTTTGPLVIALHGVGADPRDIMGAWMNTTMYSGCILVTPHGPRKYKNGYAWRYPDESQWVVLHALDRAIEEENIETSKILVAGFSQGATVAFNVALANPQLIRGVVCSSGQYDLTHIKAPLDLEKEAWPKFFLMCGSEDVRKMSAQAARDKLRRLGFSVVYKEYAGVGHSLPEAYDAELQQGYQFIMGD